MRFALPLIGAAVASALTIGCADQPSPTAPSDAPTGTLEHTAIGGSESAVVERGTADIGVVIVDEARGLTTAIGNSFAELAVLCAGGQAPAAHDALIVFLPTDAVKLLVTNPEAEVVVWQLASGDLCGVLAITPPYAEGTARFRLTDNEATPFPIGPGGNSGLVVANGSVTVAGSGEELNYAAVAHFVFPPGANSFEEVILDRADIRLN